MPFAPVRADHFVARERAVSESDAPRGDALAVELARRAQRGDREAFGRLAERFHGVVHGIALAHGPRREVRDLVQEVFLLALRSIGRLEEPERFPGWLASIARNAARDAHKRARGAESRERKLEGELEGDFVAPDEPPCDEHEEAERALVAVRALPEAFRETLILRLVEGLSGPEIAARTGMTHGSVRVNLTRGMKLLRERLERKAVR
ncbi:MAG: sigma-70 family RNA polymerase sigma factor [Planctomycetes bacterium]|nr:sigma-70 family RNA polymerase sigma factor [Planctomycetota bacterium]